MKCETCHGWGWTIKATHYFQRERGVLAERVPCPDCNGSGTGYCCDGLREQPGPTKTDGS